MKKLFITFASLLFSVSVFSEPFWSLTGNADANTSHFIGTTNNNPFTIKVNNRCAGFTGYQDNDNVSFGYLSMNAASKGVGSANTAFGAQAMQWNSAASGNSAFGRWALEWCTEGDYNVAVGSSAMGNSLNVGNCNVAVGTRSLFNNKKDANTAVGHNSLNGNTEGQFNAALGFNALQFNSTGGCNTAIGAGALQMNTTPDFNTAVGTSAMWNNRTGEQNVAVGAEALAGNFDGSYNTAIGTRALWSTVNDPHAIHFGYGHDNTALGYEALRGVTNGSYNVGIGVLSLMTNTTGHDNIAMGCHSLMKNTTGASNISIGNLSLNSNIEGSDNVVIGHMAHQYGTNVNGNVAVGMKALYNNRTGNRNTAVGYGADVSKDDLVNATAIGYGAVATASNQIVLGNSTVTSIWGHAHWTTTSDRRIKKNVKHDVPGLAFINKLEPVTYNIDLDALDRLCKAPNSDESLPELSPAEISLRAAQQEKVHTGFIAQDVEDAAKSVGYDFSGVEKIEGTNDLYGLRYAKLIVPLVKAVQELSDRIDTKDEIIASLQNRIKQLEEGDKLVMKALDDHVNQWSQWEMGHHELSCSLQHQIEDLNITAVRLEAYHLPTSTNNVIVNPNNIFLEQNYPNPFNHSTTIKYTLPGYFHYAKIVITDGSGRIFKQVPISTESTTGSVKIAAGFFTAGTYFYSLYADDVLIDSKKMIITK